MQLNLVEKIFNRHLDERYNDGSSEIALIIDNIIDIPEQKGVIAKWLKQ